VAVRVSERAGQERVRELAREMGITTELAPGPAIALGTSEATLVDMTTVYATIANRGREAEPRGVREIRLRGDTTPLMQQRGGVGAPVVSERTAGLLTYMMREVVRRGTGRRAQLPDREAAGKTGTTQGARDAWFLGFTADYVVGVWMGNDDNTPLTGVTGGGLPAEIWREAMVRIHDGVPPSPLHVVHPDEESMLLSGDPGGYSRSDGSGGSVVERVFSDVLRSITGGAGERSGDGGGDFEPFGAGNR
jgi:penicillin-binding protein 1A